MTDSLLEPRHCVSNNLHKTARAVTRIYAEEMRPAGLARSQFAILNVLETAGPQAISALAEHLFMDRTTLTRNLKPLRSAGLISRQTSTTDARVALIAITPEGRRKVRQARRYWRRAQARMLQMFGETQWRALERTLRELRALVS
ncbi:MAG: MarR family transcriptional regulator [Pseudomonadales bacterium]